MVEGLSSYFELGTTSEIFTLRVNWSETYNASMNKSCVTVSSVEFKSTSWYGFTYYPDGIIKINGVPVITMHSVSGVYRCSTPTPGVWSPIIDNNGNIASGSVDVIHNADGTKNIEIEIAGNRYAKCFFYETKGSGASGWGCAGSQIISLTTIPTYTLSVSEGSGSNIVVSRTASGYAGTGDISSGTRLYCGDKLKITFSAEPKYRLLTTTVNGIAFTSGNTHTVTGNVSVVSVAQMLASVIGATDASIGSVSTITVTQFNTAYYHSIQYQFGDESGYITASGGTQSAEVRYKTTTVAFSVPTSFYRQIPNSKTGTCKITCRTYESVSSPDALGDAEECTFIATASQDNCSPVLSVNVRDTNSVTKALTGNENIIIRYKSIAHCTVTATAREYATIKSVLIDGAPVTVSTSDNVTYAEKSFPDADKAVFEFSATDSRGYTSTNSAISTLISYIKLTCNPKIERPTPTGNTMTLSFSGNVYRGSFGACSNTLTLKYRYRVEGGSYGSWKVVDPANVVFGVSNYRSVSAITLPDEFDYNKSYEFQVQATDGSGEYVLSTATTTVPVRRGIPVFDWGEDDFNVNVQFMLKNVNILNIIYPIGSVYIHSEETLPEEVSNIGEWSLIQTEIQNTYAWKRIS